MQYTVQDVFKRFGDKYLGIYRPTYEQKTVYNKILQCRTEQLGTRIYKCGSCEKRVYAYNSCKDRHCPMCQSYRKEVWIEEHRKDILNTPYFHVVLTPPKELHVVFYHNQKTMYDLLFDMASKTILELCESKKYLGAKVGITAMLHTWSQKGNYYPHLHMIVTGGGINKLGRYIYSKKDFLPNQVIAKRFSKNMLQGIKRSELEFFNKYEYLNKKENFDEYLKPLYDAKWGVFSKEPFNNVEETYEYLGKYAFRVCMTNDRIEGFDDTHVYFNYKDHNDRSIKKVMKLRGEEFIRKFLLHALPKSYMKIRYYGILAGKNKKDRMKKLKILTKTAMQLREKLEILNKIVGRDVTKCTCCGGTLKLLTKIFKPPPGSSNDKTILVT